MLSIKKMGRGSEDYYLGLTSYFLRRRKGRGQPSSDDVEVFGSPPGESGFDTQIDLPGEPAGQWIGRGCPAMGLFGIVLPEELKPLMLGFHPGTGEALVQNPGAPNRVPGWDFTFSAPKSVSILWSQADETIRRAVEVAHQQSVADAINLAEAELAFSRIGKGGASWLPVKLVVAAFEHGTSRNEDAQLHTHCLVLNVGVDGLGRTRALFSKPLYVNRDLLGAYYRASLSQRLRLLGFHTRKHGRSFEVVGVPDRLIEVCSSRRGEILAHLDQHGRRGGVAAAVATLETRKTKGELPPRAELFDRWQNRNRLYGFHDVSDLMHPSNPQRQGTFKQAIDAAIAKLTAEQSHFSKTALLAAALQEAPALGLPPEGLLEAARRAIEQATSVRVLTSSFVTGAADSPKLVDLGSHNGQQRLTTPEVLEEEATLLETVGKLKAGKGASVPEQIIQIAVDDQMRHIASRSKKKVPGKSATKLTPSPEQLAAARHMTQGSGQIRVVTGVAGSGKTDFPIAIATRAWEEAGYNVHAATPTAKASRVLQRATGLDSQTVTKALGDYELPWSCILKHHLRQLKNAALGRQTHSVHKPAPIKLDANSILLIDEASMLSTRHMSMLTERALKSGATLVLVGDQNQLPPVGRGAPFTSIAYRVGAAQLTETRRQEEAWARKVAELASHGEVRQALQMLSERNSVRASSSVTETIDATIAHWDSLGAAAEPAKAIILASTNEECEALNQRAQQHRLAAGILNAKRSIPIQDVHQDSGITYKNRIYQGDQIAITRNNRGANVDNGEVGTVIGINTFHHNLVVQFPDGRTTVIPANSFPHLRLGYAVTPYKAQGDSYQHALIFVTESEQSKLSFNVQVSRARESTTIFTTRSLWDPKHQLIHQSPLADLLSRQPDLRLASDLMDKERQRETSVPQQTPPLELGALQRPLDAVSVSEQTANVAPPAPPFTTHATSPPPNQSAPIYVSSEALNTSHPPTAEPPRQRPAEPLETPSDPKAPASLPIDALQSAPRKPRHADPLEAALPPLTPTAPLARRKRKKKRRGDPENPVHEEGEAVPQAQAIEEELLPPVDAASPDDVNRASVSPAILPEEFMTVPVPSVSNWRPSPLNISADRVPLLPEDFMRFSQPPRARHLVSRIRDFDRLNNDSPSPAQQAQPLSISIEEARANPSYLASMQRDAVRNLRARLLAQHDLPPDQIDIISVRQWEEKRDNVIEIWIEITYRIRMFGPRDLTAAIAIPFPV